MPASPSPSPRRAGPAAARLLAGVLALLWLDPAAQVRALSADPASLIRALRADSGAATAGEGDVTAELTVRRVVRSAAGRETLASAEGPRPGDILEYRAVYTNRGAGTVRDFEGTLPIPPWAEYLPGTAAPAGAAASSDGRTYGPVPLRRSVKRADGREALVDVPAAAYRFLRWRLGDLAPGAHAVGVFRVRVATAPRPAPAGIPSR